MVLVVSSFVFVCLAVSCLLIMRLLYDVLIAVLELLLWDVLIAQV